MLQLLVMVADRLLLSLLLVLSLHDDEHDKRLWHDSNTGDEYNQLYMHIIIIIGRKGKERWIDDDTI